MSNKEATKEERTVDDTTKPRRVQPWQLIFDNGNWNLHALDVVKNDCRRYTLSEIKKLCACRLLVKFNLDNVQFK